MGVVAEGKVVVEGLIELATLLDLGEHGLDVNSVVDPAEGSLVVASEGLNGQVLKVGVEARGTVLEVSDLEEANLKTLEETTGPLTSVCQVSSEG